MLCSVIIRTYNEERHITRLLTGISQQTLKDVEVVLVDSGSTDGTVAAAQRFPINVMHIDPREFTFGRSFNTGIAAARGDLIAMISAHCYPVYPDWLERLLEPFADERVAITYGKQRAGETSYFSECEYYRHLYPDQPILQQDHPFCNNANSAIRRALWVEHPFDERLPGLEDLGWARWATDQTYRVVYVPEAEIIHLHNETPRAVYNRFRREGMGFKQIYPGERFGMGDCLAHFLSNATSDLSQAARQKKLGKTWWSILWYRWMQFWGTYQGYRQPGPVTAQLRRTFYYAGSASEEEPETRRTVQPIKYS